MSTARIAQLNDALRRTFLGGKVLLTQGVRRLSEDRLADILKAVQRYDHFTEDNDPYGERDFGSIDIAGTERVFWKIVYYDPSYEFGSEDPADPKVTRRVLTIMLASEY